MNYKKTILIDLDGVLNTYNGIYTDEIPPMKPGADNFLSELKKYFKVIIFTTRNEKQVLNWLKENKLDTHIEKITNIKEPAYLIIDDRCITFDGNFRNILEKINNFKVWYKL